MITQYSPNGGFNDVPQQIRNVFANHVGLLDDYIIFNTAENEYTGLILDRATRRVTEFKFSRQSAGGYNSYYRLVKREVSEFAYSVSNEMYVYSNHLGGSSLDCPIYGQVTSYSLAIITCVLAFAILFKGVLFKCLKFLRRR